MLQKRFIDKKDFENLREFLEEKGRGDLYDVIVNLSNTKSVDEAREIYPDFDYSHVEDVAKILENLGVEFELDFGVARGLDYYTGIVFEFYSDKLGAQKQICGGGAYRLAKLFGGEDVPSTGFAIGFDRVVEVAEVEVPEKPLAVVVSFGDYSKAQKVAEIVRKAGVDAIVDVMGRSVKKQLSFANSVSADYAVFAGEEFDKGIVRIKDLRKEEQVEIKVEEIEQFFNGRV
ncbi:ATP phosphoribosyltransferase regulatory subunit [Archaeoglobus sp.]|uniref:ATP phosphoribosyltransferase regulatory subunit n=1 Tax=Archaeoglobus sp. TaxID=1872626 RepID=UPI0024ABA4DA|nr:ATP phosphoribosyltransferase regulatory subunit [Archaeoglobus sp.]MDI3498484.1 histidyl-tRNA synthetase [Archaeoglobus sp.]